MSVRVQVILSDEEKAYLQQAARRRGLSLSAWIRRAALERLEEGSGPQLNDVTSLQRFFAECDEREQGEEPDWDEHLDVMQSVRTRGASNT